MTQHSKVRDRSADSTANKTAVQVALRIRPLTEKDRQQVNVKRSVTNGGCTLAVPSSNTVCVIPYQKQFTFDHVFGTESTQQEVYDTCIVDLLDRFVEGYNITILAYGQTSSGKTYTMGTDSTFTHSQHIGIIPRAMETLFTLLKTQSSSNNNSGSNNRSKSQKAGGDSKVTLRVSFIEIYNEDLIDLLNPGERLPVNIREDHKGNIKWSGVREVLVKSVDDILNNLAVGSRNRQVGSTDMNEKSSRSHAIFSVTLQQERWAQSDSAANNEDGPTSTQSRGRFRPKVFARTRKSGVSTSDGGADSCGEWVITSSKFHFVDLAGSERLKRTNAAGERAKEGISINTGLLALGNVISALGDTSKKATHIPYRDSKLTRLLQDSLGGNSQTLMIACVSPAESNLAETVNTIKYANRARNIKNNAAINREALLVDDPEHLRGVIAKLTQEIKLLKQNASGRTPGLSSSANSGLRKPSLKMEEEGARNAARNGNRTPKVGNTAAEKELKTLEELESELAMTRAALRHSEAILEQQERQQKEQRKLISEMEKAFASFREKTILEARDAHLEALRLQEEIRHLEEELEKATGKPVQRDSGHVSMPPPGSSLQLRLAGYENYIQQQSRTIRDLEERLAMTEENSSGIQQQVMTMSPVSDKSVSTGLPSPTPPPSHPLPLPPMPTPAPSPPPTAPLPLPPMHPLSSGIPPAIPLPPPPSSCTSSSQGNLRRSSSAMFGGDPQVMVRQQARRITALETDLQAHVEIVSSLEEQLAAERERAELLEREKESANAEIEELTRLLDALQQQMSSSASPNVGSARNGNHERDWKIPARPPVEEVERAKARAMLEGAGLPEPAIRGSEFACS
ncbi:uncharacterized protein VTP21DRAFT_1180 [Calcarisporiella thermophila]|uniref:uncharacterized protein n=1 Tax=Calcarisporiella thermophila TaxID=911321 RepID=UPI00374448F2